jgi:hypothetical protein
MNIIIYAILDFFSLLWKLYFELNNNKCSLYLSPLFDKSKFSLKTLSVLDITILTLYVVLNIIIMKQAKEQFDIIRNNEFKLVF